MERDPKADGHVRLKIFGRAHPERKSWWFDPIALVSRDRTGEFLRLEAAMAVSQFHVTLSLRDDLASEIGVMDAKVEMEDFVRGVLDTIGLFEGAAVDCEVVQVEDPDGTILTLDSSFPGLALERTEEDFRRLAIGAQMILGVRLGLADFRMGIRQPMDTLFLCYRGLDGLRADVASRERIESDTAAWGRLREVTEIQRSQIDSIKDAADARRHGRPHAVSEDERRSGLLLLQEALLAYVKWCWATDERLASALDPAGPPG